MSSKYVTQLENINDYFEKNILESNESNVLLNEKSSVLFVGDIRALINNRVLEYKNKSKTLMPPVTKKAANKRLTLIPRDMSGRIKYLKQLMLTSSEFSPQISPLFSGKRKPTENEINLLFEELVKKNIFKKK